MPGHLGGFTWVGGRGRFLKVKISRASTYAILAACQLSDSKSAPPVPCSKLAKLGRMPERFLLQVLRSMVRHGILSSTRGVDGGYRLNRPASEISLLDVIEATDGAVRPASPELAPLSAKAQDRVAQALSGIANDTKQRLSQVKLSQLKPAPKK